jgi:hypothetical protein
MLVSHECYSRNATCALHWTLCFYNKRQYSLRCILQIVPSKDTAIQPDTRIFHWNVNVSFDGTICNIQRKLY